MIDSGAGHDTPHLVPEEWRRALLAQSHKLLVRAGQVILSSGLESRELYLLLEGSARAALFASSGREVAIREIGTGELFGELAALDGLGRASTVVATTDGAVAVIPATVFFRVLEEHPEMALWLLRRFVGMIRSLTEKIFELSALPVRNRLHCELLRLARDGEASAEGIVIAASPTHADLAARVGSHREMVTREFGYLTESGILRQTGRRLVLLDLQKLMHEIQRGGGDSGSGALAGALN